MVAESTEEIEVLRRTGKRRLRAGRSRRALTRPGILIAALLASCIVPPLSIMRAAADDKAAAPAPITRPAADAAEIERLIRQLGSDRFAEREAAQKELVRIGPPAAGPLLAAATASEDREIAERAENALVHIGEPVLARMQQAAAGADAAAARVAGRVARQILDWRVLRLYAGSDIIPPAGSAHGPVAEERMAWAAALGELGDARGADYLLDRLTDAEPRVRDQAAAALRKLSGELFAVDEPRWRRWWAAVRQPTESLDVLKASLDDPRLERRRKAIWKLAYTADAGAIDLLLERFVNRAGGTSHGLRVYDDKLHYEDRLTLKMALLLRGAPAAGRLIPVAGYGWNIKEDACDVLTRMGPAATDALVQALENPPPAPGDDPAAPFPDFRLEETLKGVAHVLARTHPPEALLPLVRACGRGIPRRSPSVPYELEEALLAYDSTAVKPLQAALQDPALSKRARVAAAIALLDLGNPAAADPLKKFIAEGSQQELHDALQFFGRTRNKAFLPLVEQALPRMKIQQSVIYTIAYCGGRDAIPLLRKYQDHPDKGVRYGVKVWLEKLAEEEPPPAMTAEEIRKRMELEKRR